MKEHTGAVTTGSNSTHVTIHHRGITVEQRKMASRTPSSPDQTSTGQPTQKAPDTAESASQNTECRLHAAKWQWNNAHQVLSGSGDCRLKMSQHGSPLVTKGVACVRNCRSARSRQQGFYRRAELLQRTLIGSG
jgi:hypothetical protein